MPTNYWCDYEPSTHACRVCGVRYGKVVAARVCEGEPPPPGLGDMIASTLDAVGITKERVQALASTVGIKECGCNQRQQAANEFGRKYLGIGVPKGS